MPVSVQSQNIDYLKKFFGEFYQNMVKPEFFLKGLKVQESGQTGNYLLSLDGIQCNLHSKFSVEREMEMLFKPVGKEKNPVIVIFGLGYGHCIDYIKKKRIQYKKLVIFEPCTNILQEVLKKRSVQELLGMKDLFLHLFRTPNDMAKYLLSEALESKTVKILYHLSYMSLFTDIYDNVLRSFRGERISVETSINTMRAKAVEWNTNQLKSIQTSNPSAAVLSGRLKNVPGIIASAGPSLEKHYDILKSIGDRALIVAPGSTTRIFNARGQNAHIALSIDSNVIQAGFYKDYALGSVLVGSYRLHPDVYNNFPNAILNAVLSTEYLARYYIEWSKQTPFMISDHASVSSAAIDLLYLLGCDPIILIGQDLSYRENRNYADAAANSVSEAQAQSFIPDTDIYGQTVYTDYGYKSMQNDFENQGIYYKGKVRIYNATEGGLGIYGIENVKLADVYEKYIKDRKNDVAERIAAAVSAHGTGTDDAGLYSTVTIGGSGADARRDGPNAQITDFFSHLLDKCGEIEKLITEKEGRFVHLAKLSERGVSNSRLNNEMRFIQDYNKKFDAIPLFKQVIFPNIESSLTFFRAGGKHIADGGADWEGAAVFEHKLDEFAFDYINLFKALILREMVSDLAQQPASTPA